MIHPCTKRPSARQGYLTLALDNQKYALLARNLALSIQHRDPGRPISVIINSSVSIPERDRGLFDQVILNPDDNGVFGCAHKIFMFDKSPYEQTLFIDADSLLIGQDIEKFWSMLQSYDFTVVGDKAYQGHWGGDLDIGEIRKHLGIPYVVRMNSGVIYFKRGAVTSHIAEEIKAIFDGAKDLISSEHRANVGEFADEPIIGAAMGRLGLEPLPAITETGTLMVMPLNAKVCELNVATGQTVVEKGRHIMHPQILHFSGNPFPRYKYIAAARHFGGDVEGIFNTTGLERDPAEIWPAGREPERLASEFEAFLEQLGGLGFFARGGGVSIHDAFGLWLTLKYHSVTDVTVVSPSPRSVAQLFAAMAPGLPLALYGGDELAGGRVSDVSSFATDARFCKPSATSMVFFVEANSYALGRLALAKAKGFRFAAFVNNFPMGLGAADSLTKIEGRGDAKSRMLRDFIEWYAVFPPLAVVPAQVDSNPAFDGILGARYPILGEHADRYRWFSLCRVR